jgi:transglutaminase-like putative cysteine protease
VEEKRPSRLTFQDYALSGVAACLSAYSAGIGVVKPQLALFFVVFIAAGTLCSALLQSSIPRSISTWDGLLYTMFAVLGAIFSSDLNSLLPEEGFPPQLRVAGWLCWMLVFGSFVMWRDSTVLFQAVPGIALFGLVGTWDTFKEAPFLFFGFLLCFATLFARSHARSMVERATESGYVSTDLQPTGDTWLSLRKGPWRWMAGPEWALGSAFAVVLISLIGAPIFQWSLKGVAGFVRLPVPPTPQMQRARGGGGSGSLNYSTADSDVIGNGPHGKVLEKPIFRISFSPFPLMRYRTYAGYTGHGWTPIVGGSHLTNVDGSSQLYQMSVHGAKRYSVLPFALQYIDGHFDSVPIPGDMDVTDFKRPQFFTPREDGTYSPVADAVGQMPLTKPFGTIDGQVRLPILPEKIQVPPDGTLPPVYSNSDEATIIPGRVRQLAQKITAGLTNDFQKAEALRKGIADRCTYDINAPATPPGSDPVEHFLMESKLGYCDVFASSLVLMARSLNLPARYVVGYAPFTDGRRATDGFYTIYQTDYHAWAEIYFQDVGWMPFDATEGAASVPGDGRGSSNDKTSLLNDKWFRVGVGTILGVLLVGTLWIFIPAIARGLRRDTPGRQKIELERIYVDLVGMMEQRTGRPRRPSQTPYEYLQAVKPYLDGSYEPVKIATDSFVATFYGNPDPSPAEVFAVRDVIKEAKNALRSVKRPKDERNEISLSA